MNSFQKEDDQFQVVDNPLIKFRFEYKASLSIVLILLREKYNNLNILIVSVIVVNNVALVSRRHNLWIIYSSKMEKNRICNAKFNWIYKSVSIYHKYVQQTASITPRLY